MTDAERPRGVKATDSSMDAEDITQESTTKEDSGEESSAGQSDAKRAKRITREEKEDAMLPDLKPAPGNTFSHTCILFYSTLIVFTLICTCQPYHILGLYCLVCKCYY